MFFFCCFWPDGDRFGRPGLGDVHHVELLAVGGRYDQVVVAQDQARADRQPVGLTLLQPVLEILQVLQLELVAAVSALQRIKRTFLAKTSVYKKKCTMIPAPF